MLFLSSNVCRARKVLAGCLERLQQEKKTRQPSKALSKSITPRGDRPLNAFWDHAQRWRGRKSPLEEEFVDNSGTTPFPGINGTPGYPRHGDPGRFICFWGRREQQFAPLPQENRTKQRKNEENEEWAQKMKKEDIKPYKLRLKVYAVYRDDYTAFYFFVAAAGN